MSSSVNRPPTTPATTATTATKISAAQPWFSEEDIATITAGIAEVLRSGRLILGPKARELETLFAARVGTKHAVAVASCSAALEIAYRHFGVRGREVIVPTNTFVATANAVIAAGGTPVFCDMSADDFCLDVDDALNRITPRTAAVVVVHIAGMVAAGIDRLRAECRPRGIAVIEDCAHSHGARLDARETGSLGDAGCWSFYPTKILTCGVGGLITTDDDKLAGWARSLRHHGQGASIEEIVNAGNDWLLDEIRAVVALAQVRRLDEIVEQRRRVAARYAERLAGDPRYVLPRPAPGTSPTWYKYPVLLPEGVDRDAVRGGLLDEYAIEAGSLYSPPCHLMPVFRNALGTGPGMLPIAERVLSRQITLPMHSRLELADVDRVVTALGEVVAARS
jgi:perosamine synthetase